MVHRDSSFIYGLRPVLEALESGCSIDKILLKEGSKKELLTSAFSMIRSNGIPYQYVPQVKLNRITRKNHQGIIAFLSPIDFQSIENILPGIFEKGKMPFLLMLDQLTDVRNFGAIVRTAECAGVDAIVISGKHFARIGEDAIKTSAGALFNVPVCRSLNLETSVEFIQSIGIQVVAVTPKAELCYYEMDFINPLTLVMGSEGRGISHRLMEKIRHTIRIPLEGSIESLNVSVAAGIVMYEVVRQRKLPPVA